MKVIVGCKDSGKTTILFHYAYNEIAKLLDSAPIKQTPVQTQ